MERIICFTMEADNPSKKCSWFFVYRQFSFFLNTSYYKKIKARQRSLRNETWTLVLADLFPVFNGQCRTDLTSKSLS